MAYTSCDKDDLQKAFGLAHRASESDQFTPGARAVFRAIALSIWKAHGEKDATPPAGAGRRIMETIEAAEAALRCQHEHLNMDGICHRCGEDRRGL